ncbi:MAG: hypothetical protein JO040_03320 [Gemmatimonadetes bacterium]|nr:hypothetical protein [Gemmatimonadota bacterium]
MRAVRLSFALLLLPLLAPLAACDSTTGLGDPLIVVDTLTIGAPSVAPASVPSAVDVVSFSGGAIGGGRFPERPLEAEQWDFTVRLRNGSFAFYPRAAVGVAGNRAGITQPMDTPFDDVREAPASSRFVMDSAVVVRQGATYVVRSRIYSSPCFEYARVQPLELNAAAGTVKLQVATSATCQDTRLVPKD